MRFGSQVVAGINSAGQAQNYIAEGFSIDDDSNVTVSKNEKGVPNKQFFTDEVPTGSATLQLADETTKVPKKYSEMPFVNVDGDTIVFLVKKVGQAFQSDGETKVTVDLRKKLG